MNIEKNATKMHVRKIDEGLSIFALSFLIYPGMSLSKRGISFIGERQVGEVRKRGEQGSLRGRGGEVM